MSITVYRADNRTPAEIKAAGGFKAWVQLDTPTSRQLITRIAIDPGQAVTLPRQVTHISDFLRNWPATKLVGIGALYQEIRKETSRTTMHISTELTEGVGGRSASHIYRIECPVPNRTLYQWPPVGNQGIGNAREVRDAGDLSASRVKTFLLTDSKGDNLVDMIQAADIIAIYKPAPDAGEVAFLTEIGLAWITHFKRPGAPGWDPMLR